MRSFILKGHESDKLTDRCVLPYAQASRVHAQKISMNPPIARAL